MAALKNITELILFAEKAVAERWGYVWGASGEIYDLKVAERLLKYFCTDKYNEYYYLTKQYELWKNRHVCDCSGLIRAFVGISVTAQDLYNKCTEKAKITSAFKANPTPGYLVFCGSSATSINHVGVVVANGYVIHCTNSNKGVIKEKLSTSTRGWIYSGKATSLFDYVVADATVNIAKENYNQTAFIKECQGILKMNQTGKADDELLRRAVTISATINKNHTLVTPLERYLKALSYYSGAIEADSGKTPCFGSGMMAAVKQYQKLVVKATEKNQDGIISWKGATWKNMFNL